VLGVFGFGVDMDILSNRLVLFLNQSFASVLCKNKLCGSFFCRSV
jgi:hypothetical protein